MRIVSLSAMTTWKSSMAKDGGTFLEFLIVGDKVYTSSNKHSKDIEYKTSAYCTYKNIMSIQLKI